MGAWGTGPFDNTDATDFAATLDDLDPEDKPEAIREALTEAAEQTDYLERDAAAAAIAAAAVVAAQQPEGDPTDEIYGPKQQIPDLPEDLRQLALKALTRVLAADSELNELWTDNPDGETWYNTIAQLTETLTTT